MINWGIIGCGDVTEVKSGPAFNKVPGSRLIAVMRRDTTKAADYAKRHQVDRWYADADALIQDPGVNAIYIATPPDAHEKYTLAAIKAGKPVYVEKPMALNYAAAKNMAAVAAAAGIKLTVAHYRRQWPLFLKLKSLLAQQVIGEIRFVRLQFTRQAPAAAELTDTKNAWRVNPAISGGGLFHDLAPHQLDILYYLLGDAEKIAGMASNQGGHYAADDIVTGMIRFTNGVLFSGTWCFTAAEASDDCEIIGSTGTIHFSFFSKQEIRLTLDGQTTEFTFDPLAHVQQPMIAEVVNYFSGNASNPCSGEEGALIMSWMEQMTGK
ncbi:MAG TPA: Gfo/Idh/MocA family oxidoreductase [Chitinophagaceae bacterium]|nr:Gfo/Idh/MocA family oxidoreductase [Chitinophagaceae bacterium]HPH32022.1 Gfo/Idh/MocA family oxidoreductase [Chitinophagaceae bacterium]HPN57915.1 Gfo/Idh/MocA family oxidoreductase [Chitinophagaceae bacterium]